ncbi:hypothetical protein FEM48_Zijuj05G0109400 [Ziziphus jujuba var. spinosa]|uniref:Mediator of RNA polymerase II transcription subunit 25 n=1 Tax=Ziziphus jujuba var. spinosa TaxID=714518 RepID=A0A978VEJ8_ZIZJJ|nr:hypothetical protein FEM48_Zijuj05G0109400 [Ziziphus jujuba var. spinosa]
MSKLFNIAPPGWLVQSSGWTTDVTLFFSWLNGLCFNGYILEESCIAESLAEALVWYFGNAEGVAVSFTQFDSSLSIICTKDFPRLRHIFNMANGRTEGVGSSSENNNLNHDNLLVLLSEKFPEAHAAVYNHQQEVIITSPPDAQETTVDSSAVCEDLGLDELSEEDKRLLWEILNEPSLETNQPQATSSPAESIGEVEPVHLATVSCAEVQSAYPPNPYLPSNTTGQSTSPPAASFSSSIPHQKHISGFEPINVLMSDFMTLNHAIHLDYQPAQLMRFLAEQSWRASGVVPHQTWFAAGTEYPNQLFPRLGFANVTCNLVASSVSQMATNFNSNISLPAGVLYPAYTGLRGQYSTLLPTRSETLLMGKPRSAQTISSSCSLRVSSTSSSGFANAIPGVGGSSSGNNNIGYDSQPRSVPSLIDDVRSQLDESQAHGVADGSSSARGEMSDPNPIQSSSSPEGVSPEMDGGLGPIAANYLDYENERYELAWEGTISAQYQEQQILVSSARAYKKITAPAILAALWPQKLQMGHVLSNFRLKRATSQAEFCENMIIDVTAQHIVYEQLRKRELCVRIDLPSQTLIFQPTSNDLRFIGTLFSGELPTFSNFDTSLNLLPEQPRN